MNFEINYQLIGKRLRAIRKKRKLTQEKVAELSDLSPQHISGIECGSAPVSLPALIRLCNALDTTPNEILLDSVEQSKRIYLKEAEQIFNDCTPVEIYLILSQAESLKKALRDKGIV